jgi:hypothetical protein
MGLLDFMRRRSPLAALSGAPSAYPGAPLGVPEPDTTIDVQGQAPAPNMFDRALKLGPEFWLGTAAGFLQPGANMGTALANVGGQLQQRRQRQDQQQERDLRQEDVTYQRGQRARTVAQQRAIDDAISRLPPAQQDAARADPEGFFRAQTEASAPITPAQQASFDLEKRGQNIQAEIARTRAGLDNPYVPKGADMTLARSVDAAAMQSSEALSLLDQFDAANRQAGTGYGADTWGLFHSPEFKNMQQIGSLLQTMTAPQGQGAVSDMERALFAQSVPGVGLSGAQNHQRIQTLRSLMQVRQARSDFYAKYGEDNRSLRGAEAAFQRSPQFTQLMAQATAAAGGPQEEQAPPRVREANTLPSPRGLSEGTVATGADGRRKVIRGGRWVDAPGAR